MVEPRRVSRSSVTVLLAIASTIGGCASHHGVRVRTPIAGLRLIGPTHCMDVVERLRVAHRRDHTLFATSAPPGTLAFAVTDVTIFADGLTLAAILGNMPSCGMLALGIHDTARERYTAFVVPDDEWARIARGEPNRSPVGEIVARDDDEHVIVLREGR